MTESDAQTTDYLWRGGMEGGHDQRRTHRKVQGSSPAWSAMVVNICNLSTCKAGG